jgi:hypothetical protein
MAPQTQADGEDGCPIERRLSRNAANAVGAEQLLHKV